MALRPLRLPPDVQSTIRGMHPDLKRRVRVALDVLRQEPSKGKPLLEELAGWRSLRVRLRIIYREAGQVIEIVVIGPRATIYLDAARRLGRS